MRLEQPGARAANEDVDVRASGAHRRPGAPRAKRDVDLRVRVRDVFSHDFIRDALLRGHNVITVLGFIAVLLLLLVVCVCCCCCDDRARLHRGEVRVEERTTLETEAGGDRARVVRHLRRRGCL